MKARVGWIGVGRMGGALVGRLLAAGHEVTVYNRSPARSDALARRGALVVATPAALADRDVVFTMVSDGPALREVMLGTGGLLTAAVPPRLVVDCSTVAVAESGELRAEASRRGSQLLAAPISGNPKVVTAGRATVAVSGPRAAFDEAGPTLAALGRAVTYVGDGDVARLVKICHNVLLAVVAQALAEITVLAEKGGTSRAAFLEFLNDSVMGSAFSRYKTPALVSLDFTPTFTMSLLGKDLRLGLEAARALGAHMPVAACTADQVNAAVAHGHADEDFAALLVVQAQAAGLDLRPEEATVDDGLGAGK